MGRPCDRRGIMIHNGINNMGMIDTNYFGYYSWHIAKASLLAAITTLFLIIERTRFTLRQTRQAYVAHLQQQNQQQKQWQEQQQNHNQGKAAIIFETTKKKSKSNRKNKNTNQELVNNAVNVESSNDDDNGAFVIGFFHPYCSAGGGGERVLWKFIQALGELKEREKKRMQEAMLTTNQHRRSKTKKENETNTIRSNEDNDDDVIRRNCRNISVVVYTVDEPTDNYDQDVMEKIRERFSIVISSSLHIQFVHLHEVKYLLGKSLAAFGQYMFADSLLSYRFDY